MEQTIIKHLNYWYYGMMLLAVIIAVLSYYSLTTGFLSPLDPMSESGKLTQYIAIISTIITIPASLYGHKRKCEKLSLETDQERQLRGYKSSARLRIITIGIMLNCSIAAYYHLGGYQSMIWLAGIAAIGLYFAKPTIGKMQQELQPKDPNQETY